MRSGATRPGDVASRLAGPEGVEHRQPERGLDRRGAELALDPLEDRRERVELARRVEVEQLVGERLAALEDREPVAQVRPAPRAPVGVERPAEVVRVERRLALLAAAELVAAHGAAVVLADGPRAAGLPSSSVGLGGPGQLVEVDRPLAGRAAARVAIGDGRLEAGLAARGRGQRLDRGVEVAQVGRPEDDLREQPVERACPPG